MMKKSAYMYLLLLAAGLVIAFWAWKQFSNNNASPVTSSGAPKPAGGPVTVKVQVMKAEPYAQQIRLSGSLVAGEAVQLVTESAGKVVFLDLREGQSVTKGQLLLRLNNDDLQAQLRKQEALLKELKQREKRQSALLAQKGISEQEYERVATELASLEGDVAFTKAQIAKTEIRAPFNGRIGIRYISEGAYVSPNTRIADLVDDRTMFVDFGIPEKYATRLRNGLSVGVVVSQHPDTFSARLKALEPRIDPTTRTQMARAELPNNSGKLVAGSFARVLLELNRMDDALLLSSTAVMPDMNAKKVFVVKNGKAEPVVITIDDRSDSKVLVSTGLSAGDTVVISGILKLRPGSEVKILEVQ